MYDVIIFDAHWVMRMSSFLTTSVLLCPVIPRSLSLHRCCFFQVGKFKCLFLLLKLQNVDQKYMGDITSPVMFVLSFSVSGVVAVGGQNSQCVAIESTFSKGGFVGYSQGKVILLPFLPYAATFLIIRTLFTAYYSSCSRVFFEGM